MTSGPITSWQIDGETMETMTDFIFLGSKITSDGEYSHEIKRSLLLERKPMTNLCALVTQLCPILFDPIDCSPPGSSVHEILQSRILEWVAIPFSRGFPDSGIKPGSLALQADSLPSEPPGKPTTHKSHNISRGDKHYGGEYSREKEIEI